MLEAVNSDHLAYEKNHIFTINLKNIEEIHKIIEMNNFTIETKYMSMPYMNYFSVRDPDENLIGVSEFFPEMIDWDSNLKDQK